MRPLRLADARDLLELDVAVHEAGWGTVLAPDELPQSLEDQRRRLEERPTGTDGCDLVVEVEGRVVAHGSAKRRVRPRAIRHVVGLALGVHPEFQRLGMGRLLMEGLLEWVRTQPGEPILRVELNVLADNDRAIPLYESLGFAAEGVHRKFLRRPDGSFVDDVKMALILE